MKRKAMSPAKRFSVWRRDGFCCTYCGVSALDTDVVLEVDHIVAVSAGGTDDPENLTTACKPCNWSKGPRGIRGPKFLRPRRQVSILLDKEDFAEVEQSAKDRRVSLAQVVREFIVAGIDRDRRLQAAEAVA